MKLCKVWKHANMNIYFIKKGLRNMLKMINLLEKNNQSRVKIIGSCLTFAHINSASFQSNVR